MCVWDKGKESRNKEREDIAPCVSWGFSSPLKFFLFSPSLSSLLLLLLSSQTVIPAQKPMIHCPHTHTRGGFIFTQEVWEDSTCSEEGENWEHEQYESGWVVFCCKCLDEYYLKFQKMFFLHIKIINTSFSD